MIHKVFSLPSSPKINMTVFMVKENDLLIFSFSTWVWKQVLMTFKLEPYSRHSWNLMLLPREHWDPRSTYYTISLFLSCSVLELNESASDFTFSGLFLHSGKTEFAEIKGARPSKLCSKALNRVKKRHSSQSRETLLTQSPCTLHCYDLIYFPLCAAAVGVPQHLDTFS